MDKFVCVRVVQANALDLSLFQFDYDLTFAVFFMNADKTIYGRYGSRSDHKDAQSDISLEGLRAALSGALELHQAYPGNKPLLAGKQPKPVARQRPEEYAPLKDYKPELDYAGKVVQSCMHCHQIADAQRREYRQARQPLPEEVLFPWPMPQTVGLRLDPRQKATVAEVAEASAAQRAGIRAADEIVSLNGQPLLSIADVQWVLHHAPAEGGIEAQIRRGGKLRAVQIPLERGWRSRSDISWRTTTWDLRRAGFGGMLLVDLPQAERRKAGLKDDALGLLVEHVGQYGDHAAAHRAGFKKGDIVVSFDGLTSAARETDLLAHAIQKRRPGETLSIGILRNGKRMELKVTLPN